MSQDQYTIEGLLRFYLGAIGIDGAEISITKDGDQTIYLVEVPATNGRKIGILKGRNGRNLLTIKMLMQVLGPLENVRPLLVVKLI